MGSIINDSFYDFIKTNNLTNVKLVFTSPPYVNHRKYGGETLFRDTDHWQQWCTSAIVELSKAISDSGVVWWNTGSGYENYKKNTNVYSMVSQLAEKFDVHLIDEIPWIKTSSPPKFYKNRPYLSWEHNYIFSRNPDKVTFYRDNVRRPYAPATLSRMKYPMGNLNGDLEGDFGNPKKGLITANPGGASPPNYIMVSQDFTKRPHPAPMSPALANWAIRAYSQEGDLVFDPMAGIGTTWVECEKLNREFIGCEVVQEYIDIANLSMSRYLRGDDPYNGLKKEWESRK